jgi:WD40 repeat protein
MLWNLHTGENIKNFSGNTNSFFSYLSFSPGGSWLAATSIDRDGFDIALQVWRKSDWNLQYTKQLSGCGYLSSFTFSPDGKTIALKLCESLNIYRTVTGEFIMSLPDEIYSPNVVFTKDGKSILAGTTTNRVRLIDLESQKVLKFYPTDGTNKINISPDGKSMVIAGVWDDKRKISTIEIWNIETAERSSVIDSASDGVVLSPDGSQLASLERNGSLAFWDFKTRTLKNTYSWTSTVNALSFGIFKPDDTTEINLLMAGNQIGQVILINPENREILQTINMSNKPISSVAIHPNGYILAAGAADNETANIILYNLRTAEFVKEIELYGQSYAGIWGLAFSADGQAIAAKTSPFTYIQAWDVNSGEELTNPDKIIWFTPSDIGGNSNGHLIDLDFISTDNGFTGTYQITDLYTEGVLAPSLSIEETGICQELENYTISSDGVYFALGCDLYTLPIWNMDDSLLASNLKEHIPLGVDGFLGNITDVSFSPYGYLLSSAGYDDTIRFWNAETGELLITIYEHSCTVSDIAFSMDGKYLASTSCDGTLRLWGLQR